jgi:membrane associated rhomboid family serine protease
MLLPISHDKMSVRRIPVVTVVLIVVTIAFHAIGSFVENGRERDVLAALMEARALHLEHPSLGVCEPLKAFIDEPAAIDGSDRGATEDDKERYASACKSLGEAMSGITSQRFGYVPARANVLGLFTHVFVHGDWWHVIGNMWFLFLCGLALEDRWGRLAFPVYYVVAGVVAAGVHHLAVSGSSTASLIGASGAVAGAMGAFLVLFATTKIRFVGVLGFRVFSFRAPAYVMLPLWAALEIVFGLAVRGSQTAHWAHVGGFVFGAAVAGVFRFAGVDRRLDDAVERAAVLGNDPRVDAARALVAKGEGAQAVALLEGLAKEKPESIHVWEALRDAARESGNFTLASEAARQMETIEASREGRSTQVFRASGSSQAIRASGSSASVRVSAPVTPPPAPAALSTVEEHGTPFFPAPPPKR